MNITKQNIINFFKSEHVAVVGASAKSKKFGNDVIKELDKKGFKVYTIHKTANELEGFKCYSKLSELPEQIQSIHISTNKADTNGLVIEAKNKGIKNIWVQQKSENEKTIKLADDCNLIIKECLLMFLEQVKGGHKFHRAIKGLFGKLPK
ncbi:MAG: hypothetical protein C0596_15445 [Marinilabiliales bacterium]|nr:MAG: hypothetical protein C0596_15445 [Marinilabiliales bacterium]